MNGGVGDDTSIPNFRSAGFELWLDERNDVGVGSQQGRDADEDPLDRDERYVDRQDIKSLAVVRQR